MKKTCALTGHRELPEQFQKDLLYEEIEKLIKGGCDRFLCGMAEGFDLLCLDCLVALRQKYSLFLEACIPFPEQDRFFKQEYKALYRKLIGLCDKKTVLFPSYTNGCFLARDRYMVDNCDLLFAYCVKETGGAAYTVKYAEQKKLPVVYFDDEEFES